MLQQMFTVYDEKAGAYIHPFFMATTGMALRVFHDSCRDSNHAFNRNPEDYTLFHIGQFDDTSGLVEPFSTPVSLGLAINFVNDKANTKHLEAV